MSPAGWRTFWAPIPEAAIGRRIAEGYRRIPPSTPDVWGEVGAFTERATADLLQRLDAEERAGGHDPW